MDAFGPRCAARTGEYQFVSGEDELLRLACLIALVDQAKGVGRGDAVGLQEAAH